MVKILSRGCQGREYRCTTVTTRCVPLDHCSKQEQIIHTSMTWFFQVFGEQIPLQKHLRTLSILGYLPDPYKHRLLQHYLFIPPINDSNTYLSGIHLQQLLLNIRAETVEEFLLLEQQMGGWQDDVGSSIDKFGMRCVHWETRVDMLTRVLLMKVYVLLMLVDAFAYLVDTCGWWCI